MRIVALVVLLGSLTACGTSDQSELAKRANAICRSYSQSVDRLKAPSTMRETAAYAARAHTLFASSTRELHKLDPLPTDAADYREWLGLVDQALARVAALERAARAGDEKEINALGNETKHDRTRSDALARRLGFSACATAG